MSLKLTATDDLLADVGSVTRALSGLGLTAVAVAGRSDASPLLRQLDEGEVDLVLARGGSGEVPLDGSFRIAVLRRDEARDVLLPAPGRPSTLADLPPGSRVGLTGTRRQSFLRAHRPDLTVVPPWNGGGPDESLRSGAVDALVLGATEARRLGLTPHITEALDAKAWIPSPGEGTLVLLSRADDPRTAATARLDDAGSRGALLAERATLDALGAQPGGPVGVLGLPHGTWIRLWGMVASRDGRHVVRGDVTGAAEAPEAAGRSLADLLMARGAGPFIEERAQ